jgi:spore coat polysaccharide biosynthesis predicted glycosyltransferase SpsG
MNHSASVIIRCDASAMLGYGHLMRCMALAEELRERFHLDTAFAMQEAPMAFSIVDKKGFQIFTGQNSPCPGGAWLTHIVQRHGASVLILDVRDDLSVQEIREIKKKGVLLVTIDDGSERRLACDLAFYPPCPQVEALSWEGFEGKLHVGWEWVILRREFLHTYHRKTNPVPVVLVTMGGSDPKGLTLLAIDALDSLRENFETHLVLGPSFFHHEALFAKITGARRNFIIHENVSDMASLMSGADLALACFGTTAYELAYMGIPAIYLCLDADHAVSALPFVSAGIAVNLGVYTNVSPEAIASQVKKLLSDPVTYTRHVEASRLIDGLGALRIASIVSEWINTHKSDCVQ